MSKYSFKLRENKKLGEKYYYFEHESGLPVYVFPKDLTTTYALFVTKYGSVDNFFRANADEEFVKVPDGIAHFLEHKMFESEDGEDLFAKYARTGASANAYTSFLQTMYLFSCTENLHESLEILLRGVTSPYFTKENVEKEQGIIGQEIRMCEDNVNNALYFGLMKALYKHNNVRTEIVGTIKSISEITPEILYKCYDTFYNLSNMALCVCGNVSPDEIAEICDKVLVKGKDVEIESITSTGNEPREVNESRFTKKMQLAKPIFSIGVKDVDISEDPYERLKKRVLLETMTECLFSSSSSFSTSLYEEGLTRNPISAYSEHTRAFSFVELSGESDNPEEVFERFKKYISEMKEKKIDSATFTRVLRSAYGALIGIFDSVNSIANEFLSFIMEGYDIFDYLEMFEKITLDDVNALLETIFDEKCYALATIFPKE